MKSWYVDDIREIAKKSKYTFYVPSKSVIAKLETGNLVKLVFMFESDASQAPGAERMWVEIKEKNDNKFIGCLANEPAYIKDLVIGDEIEFETKHIINSDIEETEENIVDKYIHRCFVTNEVCEKKRKIKYLYREEGYGEHREGIVDSGWRIMAGDETQEYMDDETNLQIRSLGSVLNIDDSIIDILEAPIGSVFEWDDTKGSFVQIME